MLAIDYLIRDCNPFARAFKNMGEVVAEEARKARRQQRKVEHVTMVFYKDLTMDQRRYNTSSSDEIAVVFKNKDGLPPSHVNCHAQLKISQNRFNRRMFELLQPSVRPYTLSSSVSARQCRLGH